jgi:hypothetical protein
MELDQIRIRGAREHNLRSVDLEIPKKKLVVFTGVSGSGKSSLAFDTLYAEGQRRYVESLSAYARQFLGRLDKPKYDSIRGLSPTISIEQATGARTPPTVGNDHRSRLSARALGAVSVQHRHAWAASQGKCAADAPSSRLVPARGLFVALLLGDRRRARELLRRAETASCGYAPMARRESAGLEASTSARNTSQSGRGLMIVRPTRAGG